MSILELDYKKRVIKELQNKFNYENIMQVPKLKKIIINMGIAKAIKDKNAIEDAMRELTMLSGQKPVLTLAKKAISNFKLREKQVVGLVVTLRGKRMYDFLYRFVNIVAPRIRDFRGFNRKCDGSGNYTLGLDDQQIFPEIDLDQVNRTQGMHITFVTTAKSDPECVELLKQFKMPFKD
jgi:large subunit ribosomal protein L5